MGTRCITLVIDKFDDEEVTLVNMYGHCDGYLGGHGKELLEFLKGKKVVNGIKFEYTKDKYFNGMGCLAAAMVAHFKDGLGGFYLIDPRVEDEEYVYEIRQDGEKIELTILNNGELVMKGDVNEMSIDGNNHKMVIDSDVHEMIVGGQNV